MSYKNQDATEHQVHLDNRKFNHNCEACWNEPVEAFATFEKFNKIGNVSNIGAAMPLKEPDAFVKLNTYMWASKVLGRKDF